MHRVFRDPVQVRDPSQAFDDLRAFLRSLGLIERLSGESFLYDFPRPDGQRQFASLHGRRTSATIYLYPDALGKPAGHASILYRTLDDAGLDMGSKAGPSIGVSLSDESRLSLLRDGLRELFGP
jgi:hypothetical protein